MADITIAKASLRAATTAPSHGVAAPKAGPSKFDNVRAQLAEQLTHDFKLPANTQLSPQQSASLETALRKRLSQAVAANPPVAANPSALFGGDVKTVRANLNRLTSAVNAMPASKNTSSIRDSLRAIETEYQQSAKLIGGSKDMNLQSLLKMQTQIYRMGENIDLLSKVVDQVTSGVKTIFQTQVG